MIDGAVRDVDSIIELGFPVFARAVSTEATFKNQAGRVGGEAVCGGQAVRTGDVVVWDSDGLVVLRGRTDAVIVAGEEREMRERIPAGEPTLFVLGLGPSLERLGLR